MGTLTLPTKISPRDHSARTLPVACDLISAENSLSLSEMVLPSITITCPDHNSASEYCNSCTSFTSEDTGAASIEESHSIAPTGSKTGAWEQSYTLRGLNGQGVRVTYGCEVQADKAPNQWATIEKTTKACSDREWISIVSRKDFAEFYEPVLTQWRGQANMGALRMRLLEAWDNLIADSTSKGLPSWVRKRHRDAMETKVLEASHWESEVQKLMNTNKQKL